MYQQKILRAIEVGVPVVIVGNLTVGGTGKSSLVISLVQLLVGAGYSPGVVSRGYRGEATDGPTIVYPEADPTVVGDEPLLIRRETGVPVVVDRDRVRGAQHLIERCEIDIVISDDGLQHLRLARSIEIAVIDGERRFGNGRLLPAGPLREPVERLTSVDFIVTNGGISMLGEYQMQTEIRYAVNLQNGEKRDVNWFKSTSIVAVAGIGHPDRFFSDLRSVGLEPQTRTFPDHHHYRPSDLASLQQATVLMTAKDAVKCECIAGPDWWAVQQNVNIDDSFERALLEKLQREQDGR